MNQITPNFSLVQGLERLASPEAAPAGLDIYSAVDLTMLTRLACDLFDAPIAGICACTATGGRLVRLQGTVPPSLAQDPLLLQAETLCIPDTAADPRFAGTPWLAGEAPIRFFAAAPLLGATGALAGVVFAMDHAPRVGPAWLTHAETLAANAACLRAIRLDILALQMKGDLDEVTGATKRQTFERAVEETVGAIRDTRQMCAVLCVNVDGFKHVMDTFGRANADTLLRSLAGRLQRTAGPGHMVAKLDGDEFAILMPSIASATDADLLAQQVLAAVATPFRIEWQDLPVRVSIGIALCPNHARDNGDLVRRAQMALRSAKSAGSGQCARFQPAMEREAESRRELEQDLRDAVAKGDFRLHWQPIVDCRTGALRGFEALLRWNRPGHGKISPSIFVPLAERIGLSRALDAWVMRTACHEAAEWPVPVRAAVNVSADWFKSDDICALIRECLASSGLDSQRLEVEITERVFLERGDHALSQASAIKALGVHLALDDFGTGYSSLGYLTKFPFSKVKLDKSFVDGLGSNRRNEVITTAVMHLGAGLDMRVCAEGVAQPAQLAALQALGCDEVQGYLFGRPKILTPSLIGSYQRFGRTTLFSAPKPHAHTLRRADGPANGADPEPGEG